MIRVLLCTVYCTVYGVHSSTCIHTIGIKLPSYTVHTSEVATSISSMIHPSSSSSSSLSGAHRLINTPQLWSPSPQRMLPSYLPTVLNSSCAATVHTILKLSRQCLILRVSPKEEKQGLRAEWSVLSRQLFRSRFWPLYFPWHKVSSFVPPCTLLLSGFELRWPEGPKLIYSYTNSGVLLEKVCEYLYYNEKHKGAQDVPDMEIPADMCLQLLMVADYLNGAYYPDYGVDNNEYCLLIWLSIVWGTEISPVKDLDSTHLDRSLSWWVLFISELVHLSAWSPRLKIRKHVIGLYLWVEFFFPVQFCAASSRLV